MKNQRAIWVATLLCSAAMTPFNSRAFDSGSTGTNSLNITVSSNVQVPPDGIFNYISIYVATNCTLTFTPNALNTPVYLLAQSNIVIDGVIDVSGADGTMTGTSPTVPGPGGFSGGNADQNGLAPGYGQGPGGGHCYINYGYGYGYGCGGSFGSIGFNGPTIYGNWLLVPLIGGSGGGGSVYYSGTVPGASGGAGGGAILLASSTSVNVAGSIIARGGKSIYGFGNYFGGGGSGGGVRIVAPTVSVAGFIDVSGGTNLYNSAVGYGGNGRVRIDTTSSLNAKVIGYSQAPATAPVVSYGRSLFTGLPSPASPQLYFTTVGGTNIQAGTNNSVTLPSGSSTSQVVTLCGTNFLGTVTVQIVATPEYGSSFTTNIVLNFPTANILVTTNVTINIPAYIPTHLNAYANYAVQP